MLTWKNIFNNINSETRKNIFKSNVHKTTKINIKQEKVLYILLLSS